jgi:hypothetical protein
MSAIILTTSELEAILKICRCSLKLSKRGKGVWGGGTLPGTSGLSSEQVQQVASGYAPVDTILTVMPVSLSPSPPFTVSQKVGRGLIKIFALSVQNNNKYHII